MRSPSRRSAGANELGCIVLALLLVLPAGAQAGSENPSSTYDVDPARCTIAPRTLADIERIAETATPRPASNRPKSGASIDPNSETGKTVTATIEMLFACLNAGDRPRVYALYTDVYLASILRPADLPAIATPQPADPGEYTQIVSIELHALDEERVIAKVVLDPALIPVHKIFEFILIPMEDGWRIDRVIDEIDFSLP